MSKTSDSDGKEAAPERAAEAIQSTEHHPQAGSYLMGKGGH